MKSIWLLIHGGWGGSWQWEPVRTLMERESIPSLAPDLPGMGGHSGRGISLDDFIDYCSSLIEQVDGTFNIAAFSFGGMTATALADRYASRIGKLVYIDAFVPSSGESFAHIAGEKITRQIRTYSDVMGDEEMIPPFLDPDSRYRNHPLGTLFTEVHYDRSRMEAINRLYIECTAKDPRWSFTPLLEQMSRNLKEKGWNHKSLVSDHMPMFSHSEELFQLMMS